MNLKIHKFGKLHREFYISIMVHMHLGSSPIYAFIPWPVITYLFFHGSLFSCSCLLNVVTKNSNTIHNHYTVHHRSSCGKLAPWRGNQFQDKVKVRVIFLADIPHLYLYYMIILCTIWNDVMGSYNLAPPRWPLQ